MPVVALSTAIDDDREEARQPDAAPPLLININTSARFALDIVRYIP